MISPRVCITAAGLVIKEQQILLVKHTKLGIWLAPGGHVDEHELPHVAALREVKEETGIDAQIHSAISMPPGSDSQYLPTPLLSNLHWVSKENYEARSQSSNTLIAHATSVWPRGCEQHLVWLYLMSPLNVDQTVVMNERESTHIDWFSSAQLSSLDTTEDVRTELQYALQFYAQLNAYK